MTHSRWIRPTVQRGREIFCWHRGADDPANDARLFPLYRLIGDDIVPTVDLILLAPGGPLQIRYNPDNPDHFAKGIKHGEYKPEKTSLANEIGLDQLVTGLQELSGNLVTYELWRSRRSSNLEAIVVMTDTEPPAEAGLIYEQRQYRCSESPTGFHVAEGHASRLQRDRMPCREVDCCRYCGGMFDLRVFPR